MGGAKKKGLAQAEKQQKRQERKQQKETKKTAKRSRSDAQLKKGEVTAQEVIEKNLNELAKIKALTPYAVATKYNIKINDAKNILKQLEGKRAVQEVARGRGIKVYKFVGNTG